MSCMRRPSQCSGAQATIPLCARRATRTFKAFRGSNTCNHQFGPGLNERQNRVVVDRLQASGNYHSQQIDARAIPETPPEWTPPSQPGTPASPPEFVPPSEPGTTVSPPPEFTPPEQKPSQPPGRSDRPMTPVRPEEDEIKVPDPDTPFADPVRTPERRKKIAEPAREPVRPDTPEETSPEKL